MKYLYILMLCCFISCATEPKTIDSCYPDKGIKTAKIYDENTPDGYTLLSYNTEGYLVKEEYNLQKIVYEHVYDGDTLLYTVTTNLDRGAYSEDEPDSDYIDTLFVKKMEKHPREYLYVEMESKSGTRTEFTSIDCKKESFSMYIKGDKMQDVDLVKKDGNLMKMTSIYYSSEKLITVINFTDYVFDSHGHWIERTERFEDGSSAREFRELTYY